MGKSIIRFVGAALVGLLALAATSMDPMPRIGLGIIVGLSSFILLIVGRRQLGRSFSIMPEAKALITTGLYSRIQHPMYVFLDLFLVGAIVALGWPILLLAWSLVVVMQMLQSRSEEKVLANAFGAEYGTYSKQLWF